MAGVFFLERVSVRTPDGRRPGPVVVVSGASSGIGHACAIDLCRRGFTVVAGARSEDDLARLRALNLPGLVASALDVEDAGSIEAAVAVAEHVAEGRGLAGLVNCAGISPLGPVEAQSPDTLRRVLEVNVVGAAHLTSRCLPGLRRAGGRIVNIGSIAGLSALPFMGAYSASKHALEGMTDALRVEVAPWGIDVAIVEVGAVDTPIASKALASLDATLHDAGPYAESLRAFRHAVASSAAQGLPASRVADAVAHALTARRPRTRYVVGWEATWRSWLKRLVPDRWHDRVVQAVVRLPKRDSARQPFTSFMPPST
jgi:NAD(P)-dependent dehydrogenase (short-subunit alcohol dehydrogenase family)